MYEKEVLDQEAKIKTMKGEGKDEYDIKKQVEVLEESRNMVPDCQRRLAGAHGELVAFLVSLATYPRLSSPRVYLVADSSPRLQDKIWVRKDWVHS